MRRKTIALVVAIILAFSAGAIYYFQRTRTERARRQAIIANLDFVRSGILGSVKSPSLGEYLTDERGHTLYVYADDKKLASRCSGDCLKLWLPAVFDPNDKVELLTDALSKKINAAKASDGSYQYALGDRPLYYFVGDFNPGDVNGNGFDNGKWGIVSVQVR